MGEREGGRRGEREGGRRVREGGKERITLMQHRTNS